jgi:hypothetical protein
MHHLEQPLWPAEFLSTAQLATHRALASLGERSPALADHVRRWVSTRCDVHQAEKYFTAPEGFPALALPWWLENAIHDEINLEFQSDLMSSTISGYYFIRMLDDVMDGHDVDRAVLPALHLLHLDFVRIYSGYFAAAHPFWKEFDRLLAATAEAVAVESTLQNIGEDDFERVCARKQMAAVIPMAAVCFQYGRIDLLVPWEKLVVAFTRWHQMRDDLLDWSKDYQKHNLTFLLCEAERRRRTEESVPMWVGYEGLGWVQELMQRWMEEAKDAAAELISPSLVQYLDLREQDFSMYMQKTLAMAAAFRPLLDLDASLQKQ